MKRHTISILSLLTVAMFAGCGSEANRSDSGAPAVDSSSEPAPRDAAPVGISRCEGVRPGAAVFVGGSLCTLNFVHRDGAGTEYIGTAGHCVLGESALGGEDAGETSWHANSGPEAFDANGNRIGRFAYAVLSPPKDFALIRIANGVASNPSSCHFGGPTGINEELSSDPTVLRYYGSGLLTGQLLPARSALALSMTNPDQIILTGVATPGDSGAGVLDQQGRAVGVLVTVGALIGGIGSEGIDAGSIGVTRLPPQLQRARQVLGRPDLHIVPGAAP